MGGALRKPRRAGSRAGGRGGSTPTPVLVDEKYTKPCGLYVHKSIDMQRLRKLILAGRLAPCFTGLEEPTDGVLLEECPICMLVRVVRHTEPGCQRRQRPRQLPTSCCPSSWVEAHPGRSVHSYWLHPLGVCVRAFCAGAGVPVGGKAELLFVAHSRPTHALACGRACLRSTTPR
jgi:hypothetical protein